MKWGYDPAAKDVSIDSTEDTRQNINTKEEVKKTEPEANSDPASESVARNKPLSLVLAIKKLLKESRATVGLFILFIYGFVNGNISLAIRLLTPICQYIFH